MNYTQHHLDFHGINKSSISAAFDGGNVTSDSGLLWIGTADNKLRLIERLACAIDDKRHSGKVTHSVEDLLRERIFAIAAGYYDANDLDTLNKDPALLSVCGKRVDGLLASQPTISRLENSIGRKDMVRISEMLASIVIEQLPPNTQSVTLDVDVSDDPCHGQQEFNFYNGYYQNHCYLPTYVHITGDDNVHRLIACILRPGNAGPTKGLFSSLRQIIALIRTRFPHITIKLRADGAYGNAKILWLCHRYGMEYCVGFKHNNRLTAYTSDAAKRVQKAYEETGLDSREYTDFM